MKILTAFACVLSINVASAELVVWEGTGTRDGSELRFRAIVDASIPAIASQGNYHRDYLDAITDLKIWIDGVSVPLPVAVPHPNPEHRIDNRISLRDNFLINLGRSDRLRLNWQQHATDGTLVSVSFSAEQETTSDSVIPGLLSSKDLPTEIDITLADRWGMGFSGVDGFDGLGFIGTSFTITPLSVVNLLQDLRTASEGVGPGKSLANKVILAQTYYAVPDLVSTCAVLASYGDQVTSQRGKKVPPAQANALLGDVELITSAIGCE